jgi:ABC-2 type transporter
MSTTELTTPPELLAPPELIQVRGPSAIGGGWGRFLNLIWIIAKKDYKLSYFGSALGYIWSLMQPLLFFGVLYVVFAVIVQFNKGVSDFPVLLLMNIVLFGFFQGATGAAITSVVVRENLVRKMHFPRLVIPLATVVTQSINLVFNMIVVMIFMLLYGVQPRLTWLLLPGAVLRESGVHLDRKRVGSRARCLADLPVQSDGHDPAAGAPLDDRRAGRWGESRHDHGQQGMGTGADRDPGGSVRPGVLGVPARGATDRRRALVSYRWTRSGLIQVADP